MAIGPNSLKFGTEAALLSWLAGGLPLTCSTVNEQRDGVHVAPPKPLRTSNSKIEGLIALN